MRVAVMGSGGVGGYFGGLLAQAGHDVTFIARGDHLRAIQSHGLCVESIHGNFTIQPAKATDDPAAIGGPVDLVLFTTKAWQIEDAAEKIRPIVGPQTAVLPIQNGVDASERLIAILGKEPVLGGTAHIVAFVASPGTIQQKSEFRRITMGELDGPISPRVEAIGKALADVGAQVEVSPNIQKARWTKFVFIASFSGMGAVTRAPSHELMAVPEAVTMLEQAMQEIEALSRASGVELDADVVEQTMSFCRSMAPGLTASMQRDIMEGRPSELESQNGYIAKRGAALGVPVPANTFIYSVLLPQERRARGRSEEHTSELQSPTNLVCRLL